MAILRSRDLFEVTMGEFRFSSSNDLQACDHSIIFGCVFSVDLTHYE